MSTETIGIDIHYSELRNFLVDLYKEAVNSYVDLAESIVDQKMQLLIQKKHISNANSVQFNITDDNIDKAKKNKEEGISSSWATIGGSISSFGGYTLPSYNNYMTNLTGFIEISSNNSSNATYTVSGDTIMFSGGSNSAN